MKEGASLHVEVSCGCFLLYPGDVVLPPWGSTVTGMLTDNAVADHGGNEIDEKGIGAVC